MATILLVEDEPDLGLYEAGLLEDLGHRVLRCGGSPAPLAACPMMRGDPCPLPEAADLIIFACGLIAPVRHRVYRGAQLLRAYRSHAWYGRIPMLIVAMGAPDSVEGEGPVERVERFSDPGVIVAAATRLLGASLSA